MKTARIYNKSLANDKTALLTHVSVDKIRGSMQTFDRRELFEKITDMFSWIDKEQQRGNLKAGKKVEYFDEGDSYTFEPEARKVTLRPGMSRRSFLAVAGALGASFVISGASGEDWGIAQAFADESDYGFTIVVLTKEDVGFITHDPSINTRIGDMHVTITSRANGKKAEANTNSSGQGYTNIRELSKDPSKDALSYSFWGAIKATKQGYRVFESGLVRINGGPPPKDGQPLVIPSQKDTGEPYAVKLTYDGYDIQYFETTILLSQKNDIDHTIEVTLAHVGNTTVSLWHDGRKISEANAVKQQDYALASFKGRFNQSFLKDKKTTIRFSANNKTYEIETKLVCFRDEAMDGVSQGTKPLPPGGFSDLASGTLGDDALPALSVKLPKDFPVFGGTSINLDLPSLPIYAYLSPFGSAVITTNINDLEFLEDDKGNLVPDKEWKVTTKETQQEYFKRLKEGWDKAKAKHYAAKALAADPKAKTTTTPFSEKTKLKASFATSAMLEWKYYDADKAKRWTGSYDASVSLSYSYSYTRQTLIGPVPVYFGFDITLSAMAATSSGVSIKGFFEDIKWIPGARQWSFTAGFEFGISAGIGVAGFASLGIRGMAGISITFAYVLNPPSGNDTRHLFAYLNAGVKYVLQVLLFKATGTIYNVTPPVKIFDNWKSSLPEVTAEGPDLDPVWEPLQQADLELYLEAIGTIPDDEGLDPDDIAPFSALSEEEGASQTQNRQDDLDQSGATNDLEQQPESAAFGVVSPESDEPMADLEAQEESPSDEPLDPTEPAEGDELADATEEPDTENDVTTQDEPEASEEELSPQDGEGVEPPFALTTYDVDTVFKATGESCAKLGTLDPFDATTGYDIALGPRPSTEVIIYQDAFTDPRTKTIMVGKDLYMLRFVTVKVKWGLWTYNITRLALSKYENGQTWSKPRIIDFELRKDNPTGKRRTYVYDYDFDVVATEENNKLHIMLTSGTRPGTSDNIEWYEAANHMMASYLCYDLASSTVTTAITDFSVYNTMDAQGKYRQAMFPCIEKADKAVLAFYCSMSATKTGGGFGDNFRALWRNTSGGTFESSGTTYQDTFEDMLGLQNGTHGIKDMISAPAPHAYGTEPAVMFAYERINVDTNGPEYFVVGVYPGTYYSHKGAVSQGIKKGVPSGALVSHAQSGFIVPVDADETSGTVQLMHVTATSSLTEQVTVLGRVNRGAPFMVSADNKYLFTASVMEGKMPKPSSDEEAFEGPFDPAVTDIIDTVDGEEKKLYQLYATRHYESTGSFSKFFPFAQLSNPIDSLCHLRFTGNDANSESMAFVYNSIVDPQAKQLHSNMYFTSIPFICSIQLEGVACQEDFVGVGDTCHLVFNVINTGNLGISSFSAKLCTDKDGKNVVTELKLEELEKLVVLSEEHLDPETGVQELTAADKSGVFLPGEKRLYRTTFVVPDAWKDKKEIELFVFVQSPVIARVSDGFADFGEEWSTEPYIDTYTSDALPSAMSLDLDTERSGDLEGLSRGLYRSWGDGSSKENMPRTGDSALPLAAAATAAAGIAFGMKALKEKRESNDHSE